EGIISGFAIRELGGNEGHKRSPGDLDLLASHLVELGDGDLDRVLYSLEIGVVRVGIPVEEGRVVDEILHQEIIGVADEARRLLDLVEGSDGRAEDMKYGEGDLAFFRRLEEADVAQRLQRRR